jgi:ribosomal protein L37E
VDAGGHPVAGFFTCDTEAVPPGVRQIEMTWTCSSCGQQNLGRHKTCQQCGDPKDKSEKYEIPKDTAGAQGEQERATRIPRYVVTLSYEEGWLAFEVPEQELSNYPDGSGHQLVVKKGQPTKVDGKPVTVTAQ